MKPLCVDIYVGESSRSQGFLGGAKFILQTFTVRGGAGDLGEQHGWPHCAAEAGQLRLNLLREMRFIPTAPDSLSKSIAAPVALLQESTQLYKQLQAVAWRAGEHTAILRAREFRRSFNQMGMNF